LGMAKQLDVARGEAQDYIVRYFSPYPAVRECMDSTREQARDRGCVETVVGRRRDRDNSHAPNQGLRAGAERAANNVPMPGTAAHLVQRAMVDIHAWMARQRQRALMVLQVHDALVFEVDEGLVDTLLAEVPRRMSAAAELKVP